MNDQVSDAQQSVEELWMSWLSPSAAAVLHSSHQHMQYGGARDAWATGEQLEETPKRLELVKRCTGKCSQCVSIAFPIVTGDIALTFLP